MAITFTSNIDDFTTSTRSTRIKNFTEYTSKKRLEEAEVLCADKLEMVKKIRGTFNFALHVDGRYMVITLYHANAESKYEFIILDLETGRVAECPSVKIAKAEVLELVTTAQAVETAKDETPEETEESATQEVAETEECEESNNRSPRVRKARRTRQSETEEEASAQ